MSLCCGRYFDTTATCVRGLDVGPDFISEYYLSILLVLKHIEEWVPLCKDVLGMGLFETAP